MLLMRRRFRDLYQLVMRMGNEAGNGQLPGLSTPRSEKR